MKTSTLLKLVTETQEEIENSRKLLDSEESHQDDKQYLLGAIDAARAIKDKLLTLIMKEA